MGPALAGKLLICLNALLILIFIRKRFIHRKTRLGCRLNAGLAQWAEPHGCGESAVRAWMPVRRGPTERDWSEGTPRDEGPNLEQAPLVTWGAFPSNSPKAKCLPLGRALSRTEAQRLSTKKATRRWPENIKTRKKRLFTPPQRGACKRSVRCWHLRRSQLPKRLPERSTHEANDCSDRVPT